MWGDSRESTFDAFFAHLHPLALRVAWRLLGNSEDAEDVVAEGFARAYVRWKRLENHPNVEAWLMRVITNLSIDRYRRKTPDLRPPEATSIEDQVAIRTTLAQSLRKLPKRQREVVILRYLADLSVESVGDTLGISQGAVKSHLHRALGNMRTDLGGGADSEEVGANREL